MAMWMGQSNEGQAPPMPPPPPQGAPPSGAGPGPGPDVSSTLSSLLPKLTSTSTAIATKTATTVSSIPNLEATVSPTPVPVYTAAPGECPMPRDIPAYMTDTMPVAGSYTFHDVSVVVAGACMAFTVLIMAWLIWQHLRNIRRTHEQLHILRLCLFIPVYAVCSFVTIAVPNAYVWMEGWLKVLESLALTWFFLLLHWLLVAEEDTTEHVQGEGGSARERRTMSRARGGDLDLKQDVFLQSLVHPALKNHRPIMERFGTYRRQWMGVMQCPVAMVACAIATCVTHSKNRYCLVSSSSGFAHLPIRIVQIVSIVIAVVAIIKTMMPLKAELQPHRAMSKFMAFKLLIALQILQNIIYQILASLNPSPLTATAYLSSVDLDIGIPMMITNIEMVFFSVFYFYAYTVAPYKLKPGETPALGGTGAFFRALSQAEVIAGIFFALTIKKHAEQAANSIGNAHVRDPTPEEQSSSGSRPSPPWSKLLPGRGGRGGNTKRGKPASAMMSTRQAGFSPLSSRSPSPLSGVQARRTDDAAAGRESQWSVPIALQVQPGQRQQRHQQRVHFRDSTIGVAR